MLKPKIPTNDTINPNLNGTRISLKLPAISIRAT
jgi:hypothetical protein